MIVQTDCIGKKSALQLKIRDMYFGRYKFDMSLKNERKLLEVIYFKNNIKIKYKDLRLRYKFSEKFRRFYYEF